MTARLKFKKPYVSPLSFDVKTPDDKRGRQAVGANGKGTNGEGGSGCDPALQKKKKSLAQSTD